MSDYKGHKSAAELTGKEQIFFTDPTTGARFHTTIGEIAKFVSPATDGVVQGTLTDESGGSLTDESGSPLMA